MSEQKQEAVEQAPVKKDVKKEASYTYWVDANNKSRELPEQHRPKKIEPHQHQPQSSPSNGRSSWNSLGSWEERNVSLQQLNQNLNEAITKWLEKQGVELKLSQVSLKGDFKQIFSNNKKKILYELSGSVKFEGDDLHLDIEQLTCSGDQEYKVKGKVAEEKQKLKSVSKELLGVMNKTFGSYKQ